MTNNVKKRNPAKKQAGRITGKGDYNVSTNEFSQLQSKLDRIEQRLPDVKGGLSSLGGRIGGLAGMPELGKRAGQGLSQILGFGDYNILSNSLIKGPTNNTGAKFMQHGTNGIRVTEREFLGDILSSPTANTFRNQSFPLQPTNSVTFPWLSQVARLFDQWEPNGIVFEFISTSSDFNGSAQGLGTVVMATDYNASDSAYANKREMENADYSNSAKPSLGQMHGIECDPKQRPTPILYTQAPNRADGNNQYTLGNFQCATAGVSASNVTLGELWVSYDITFYKKQLQSTFPLYLNLHGPYDTAKAWSDQLLVLNTSGGFTYGPGYQGFGIKIFFPPSVYPASYTITEWLPTGSTSDFFVYGNDPVRQFNCTIFSKKASTGTNQSLIGTYLVVVDGPGAWVSLQGPGTNQADSVLSIAQVARGFNY